MVLVMVYFQNINLGIVFLDSLENILQIGKHAPVKDLSSVFGREDQVIFAKVDGIRLFS